MPKPILGSQDSHSFWVLAIIPILALENRSLTAALNPSLLQLSYNEASEPVIDFHVSRPSGVSFIHFRILIDKAFKPCSRSSINP